MSTSSNTASSNNAELRFPVLSPEQMTARQKEVADAIAGGPRGGIRGPFLALIHNPELANCVQQLGEHLRYGAAISPAHIELIVLTVARHWNCQYVWFAHERIARNTTDLADDIIKALARGETPAHSRLSNVPCIFLQKSASHKVILAMPSMTKRSRPSDDPVCWMHSPSPATTA